MTMVKYGQAQERLRSKNEGPRKSSGVPKFSLKNLSIRGQGQTSFDKLRQVFS